MTQDDSALPSPTRPYSMSQMRTFYKGGCTFAYYLRYVQGYRGTPSAALWLSGTIVHRIIQMAYYGIPLAEAHQRVWRHACEPILLELRAWFVLDKDYHAAGNPNTKARERWKEQHPQYEELTREIEAYRQEYLTEDYVWGKTASLSGHYRWTCQLIATPVEQLLLAHPVLVEGQALAHPDGEVIARFAGKEDPGEQYRLLHGVIGHLPVVGVPDVVARDLKEGTIRVADYKVMSHLMTPEEIAVDGQLNLYVELLRQAGMLVPGQRVEIGHIYLTERQGVMQVWATPLEEALSLLEMQLVHMDRRIQAREFLPVRGIVVGALSPCAQCEMAGPCRSTLQAKLQKEDETHENA